MIARIGVAVALLAATAAAQVQISVKLPAYTKKTLPNGATLILLEKPDVPLVSVRALFKGGAEAEPADKAGINALTAELVRRGTKSRTAEQFNEQLDAMGASLSGGANRQFSYLATEFLASTQDKALELLGDVLTAPSFPEDEFKKALSQRIDQAKAGKDNPGMAIGSYFPSFYFGAGHPYGRPAAGDEVTLAKITRDDVLAWHKRMFNARNLILIAAGDLKAAAMAAKLEKIAGALPAGEAYAWKKDTGAPKHSGARLLLIDKPDATQTYFRIVTPGIHRTHPDRVPLEIVNTLFGGRFTSMLNDELRVNKGLTYGANSSVDEDRLTGAISINTYTRTEKTEEAIDVALAMLKQLREKGISKEMLDSAKNYIKGGFPTRELETADQVAGILGELEIFELNKGEVDDYFSRIDAVTPQQATEMARKWYREDNLQFLLVGNASAIQAAVKKYAPAMKVHSIKEPGFSAPAF